MNFKNLKSIFLLLAIAVLIPITSYGQNIEIPIDRKIVENEHIANKVIEEVNQELGTELRLVTAEEMGINADKLKENRAKVWGNMTIKEYKNFLIDSINDINKYLEKNETNVIYLEETEDKNQLQSTIVPVVGIAQDSYAAYTAAGWGVKESSMHLPVWDILGSFDSAPSPDAPTQFRMSSYSRSSAYGYRDLDVTARGSFYTMDGTFIRNGSTVNSFRANEKK